MAQVVGAELHLEAVGRQAALGESHDAGVVDEDVELAAIAGVALRELAHRRQVGQVEQRKFDRRLRRLGPHPLESIGAPALVATRENDVGAMTGELERRLIAEATVRPRDHGDFSAQVGDVVRRPLGHEVSSPRATSLTRWAMRD